MNSFQIISVRDFTDCRFSAVLVQLSSDPSLRTSRAGSLVDQTRCEFHTENLTVQICTSLFFLLSFSSFFCFFFVFKVVFTRVFSLPTFNAHNPGNARLDRKLVLWHCRALEKKKKKKKKKNQAHTSHKDKENHVLRSWICPRMTSSSHQFNALQGRFFFFFWVPLPATGILKNLPGTLSKPLKL